MVSFCSSYFLDIILERHRKMPLDNKEGHKKSDETPHNVSHDSNHKQKKYKVKRRLVRTCSKSHARKIHIFHVFGW